VTRSVLRQRHRGLAGLMCFFPFGWIVL
jgi:hypothetical protein